MPRSIQRSPFLPDSSLVSEVMPSPNHDARADNREPDILLIHYTGMPEPQGALEWLCKPESKVSTHYFVFDDGRIVQCVPENRRAWHAGESFWGADTDINSCSIGIEIHNPGHDHKYPDFPPAQIAAVTALCRSIVTRRKIAPERVLAHSDVAPSRKRDPGEKFPWRTLYWSGVGHWVEPVPIVPGPDFTRGDKGNVIVSLQLALARYGYRVPTDGEFDEVTSDAVTAFQRHFRPERIDGVVDSSTLMTLQALLDSLPGLPPTPEAEPEPPEDAFDEMPEDGAERPLP